MLIGNNVVRIVSKSSNKDGYGRSLMRLECWVGTTGKKDDIYVELTSFNGGPIEVYRRDEETGIHMFVGYLPYLESTVDVWGRCFPRVFRSIWGHAWKTQKAQAILDKQCDRYGEENA